MGAGCNNKIPGMMHMTSMPAVDPTSWNTFPRSVTRRLTAVVSDRNTSVCDTCLPAGAVLKVVAIEFARQGVRIRKNVIRKQEYNTLHLRAASCVR